MNNTLIDKFIEEHNKTYVHYFEAVILPDGLIEYSIPSHTYKLMMLWGVPQEEIYEGGETKDRLDRLIPIFASPVSWLCNKLNCVVCWYDQIMFPFNYTDEQVETVNKLIKSKCINQMCNICISIEDLITSEDIDAEKAEKIHNEKERRLCNLSKKLVIMGVGES